MRQRSSFQRSWRVFPCRDGEAIEQQLYRGRAPCCPWCGMVLEAQLRSRLSRRLPLGATAYDLDCRECRRFWSLVQHTDRSLRLIRMRRLVAAIRAVELEPQTAAARTVTA